VNQRRDGLPPKCDNCFVAMVQCGKRARNEACQKFYNCSSVGNAFVQYADALAMQVESHQITEAEAMARFAEYKTKTIQDAQRNQAIANSNDIYCTATGNTVSCF
jgi:hypothetical protein